MTASLRAAIDGPGRAILSSVTGSERSWGDAMTRLNGRRPRTDGPTSRSRPSAP